MDKKTFWKSHGRAIIIGACYMILFMFGGIVFVADETITFIVGILFAYFGWGALTRIQPAMFVWMPLMGWCIYFIVKFILSIIVGYFVAPYKIGQMISDHIAGVD